jgi:hypothetical protein
MAGTATVHVGHLHRPHVTRATLAFGWPHRLAAGLMVLIGLGFVVLTLAANLFHVGPAFDRLTDGFRPIMTQQAIQTDRQDLTMLSSAGTEIQTKMLPALAQQLHMTPAQLQSMMASNYPMVTAGLQAIPTITPTFNGLVNTLDAQRPYFAAADAIPTKSIPATSVPWALFGVGLVSIGFGVMVWFRPRNGAWIALAVGAVLIAGPLSLNMVHKASYADTLNSNLKPVYTQQLITQASGAVSTLSGMGTEMTERMVPDLAKQLQMQPAQFQSLLTQNFPATAAALNGLPASLGRFQNLVATFDQHLGDYKTLKPVSFEPIVWSMVGGGIALFLLGGAGVLITRRTEDVS